MWVPNVVHEAVRDLVRAREAAALAGVDLSSQASIDAMDALYSARQAEEFYSR